jgi:hypothetical protein
MVLLMQLDIDLFTHITSPIKIMIMMNYWVQIDDNNYTIMELEAE